MSPTEYCEDTGAPRGSSLRLAILCAPRDRRQALFAVHAFRSEVASIPRECSDPRVASVKFGWWRQELARLYEGGGQHPVSQALIEPVQRFGLGRSHFEQVLDAAEMDAEYGAYPTFRELTAYCHRMSGVTRLATRILGADDNQTAEFAHDMGMALQLTSVLRRVGHDARLGRIYAPEDELDHAGVTRDQLLRLETTDGTRNLLRNQRDRIESFFQAAYRRLPKESRHGQRAIIVLAELYRAVLKEVAREGFLLLEQETHLPPTRKLWIAWRTARKQKRQSS